MKDLSQIPRINEPNVNGADMFIQVYLLADGKREPFFRFGGNNSDITRRHGNLLEEFLEEAGVEVKETFIDGNDDKYPAEKGENYILTGAGEAREYKRVDGKNARVKGEWTLSGKSGSYGKGPDQEHLEDFAPYLPDGIELTMEKAA